MGECQGQAPPQQFWKVYLHMRLASLMRRITQDFNHAAAGVGGGVGGLEWFFNATWGCHMGADNATSELVLIKANFFKVLSVPPMCFLYFCAWSVVVRGVALCDIVPLIRVKNIGWIERHNNDFEHREAMRPCRQLYKVIEVAMLPPLQSCCYQRPQQIWLSSNQPNHKILLRRTMRGTIPRFSEGSF